MSWWSERVGHFVREARQGVAGNAANRRSADELGAELEAQARRVGGKEVVVDLLNRWVERCDSGTAAGSYALVGAGVGEDDFPEMLSFRQVLLRSQAFESLIEACCRIPALRVGLLESMAASSVDHDSSLLVLRALHDAAERMLLPAVVGEWPKLLEVLLLGSHEELSKRRGRLRGRSTASPASSMPSTTESSSGSPASDDRGPADVQWVQGRFSQWARHVLSLVKRSWQDDALPATVRQLDRRLDALMQQPEDELVEADIWPKSVGARISKNAIRLAAARQLLSQKTNAARLFRSRTELLCDVCAKLDAAAVAAGGLEPIAEKLVGEAEGLLQEVDRSVKDLGEAQVQLTSSLEQTSVGTEKQLQEYQDILQSFQGKRRLLSAEQFDVQNRLEEVNQQLIQIEETTQSWEQRIAELNSKLSDTRRLGREEMEAKLAQQRGLADEKLRSSSCKETALVALEAVRLEDQRQAEKLGSHLRKRRNELRHTCASYIKEERLRLEAAAACAAASMKANESLAASGEAAEPPTDHGLGVGSLDQAAEDAWKGSAAILARVGPLLPSLAVAAADPPAAALPVEATAGESRKVFQEADREGARFCADCGSLAADWASLTYAIYLCVDCAGAHRGLGVHLSFVRSLTMDVWSESQLRRMELGGSSRFRDFLQAYPQVSSTSRKPDVRLQKYASLAAAHYRRLLSLRCLGGAAPEPDPPAPDEGHLCASREHGASDDVWQECDGQAGELEGEVSALTAAYAHYKKVCAPASGTCGLDDSVADWQAPPPATTDTGLLMMADDLAAVAPSATTDAAQLTTASNVEAGTAPTLPAREAEEEFDDIFGR